MKHTTTTNVINTNNNKESEMKDITTTTTTDTNLDQEARVIAEMNHDTLTAWGWSKDHDHGFFEKAAGTRIFTTWSAAAATIAPAAAMAMESGGATDDEINRVADATARAEFEWISTTRVSEPWLQMKPWITAAEEEADLEAAIAGVIADRPVSFGADFDPDKRVLDEMNTDTIAAWGWRKDTVTGTFEKADGIMTFGSWADAAAIFAQAVEEAMASDRATPEEIDSAADAAARASFEWLRATAAGKRWLQERPSLAAAGEGSKEARKITEDAIFGVLEDRL